MNGTNLAACHPGKIGDALYTLPTLRYIYGVTGSKIDFYTSEYCEPMRSLFEYQPYINSFNIAPNYKVERMDMGCQPWYMSIEGYDQVFQLGFQAVPDRAIHQYIAHCQGIDIGLGVRYETSTILRPTSKRYICIAPRGDSSYNGLFNDVTDALLASDMGVVIIGGSGDCSCIKQWNHVVDLTGADLLTTAAVIEQSEGFVGLMSAMLVLANGFDIPRIAPHDNRSWDMRHVIYTPFNHYPVNPTADDVLALLKRN